MFFKIYINLKDDLMDTQTVSYKTRKLNNKHKRTNFEFSVEQSFSMQRDRNRENSSMRKIFDQLKI